MQLRGLFLGEEDVFFTLDFFITLRISSVFLLYVVKKVYFCLGKRGV